MTKIGKLLTQNDPVGNQSGHPIRHRLNGQGIALYETLVKKQEYLTSVLGRTHE